MNSGFEAFQNHGLDRFRIFRNLVFLRFDGVSIYVSMHFLDSEF